MSLFSKTIIGLELTDYSAQLVEIKRDKEKIYLMSFNRLILPPGLIKNGEIVKENELRIVLKSFLDGANPKAVDSRDVAILFPSSKIYTHIFNFPNNLSKEEIKDSIKFQAETVIPFSMEEMYWDFTVLDNEQNKVLFSAISNKTADAFVRLMFSLDLNPYLFGGHAEALKFGLIKTIKDKKSKLLVNIDTLSTNFMIIKNNEIKHYFSLNEGGKALIKDIAAAQNLSEQKAFQLKIQDKITKEHEKQIENFFKGIYKSANNIITKKEKDKKIGKIDEIILTGEFLNLPNFMGIAKKHLKKKKITIGDPKNYLLIDEKRFKSFKEYKQSIPYSTYFINTIGIAIRGLFASPNQGINLIPDDLKESSSTKKFSKLYVIFSVLFCAISLFLATFSFFKHQDLLYERKVLEIQKSSFDKVVYGTRYQEIIEDINTFNNEVMEVVSIDQSIVKTSQLIDNIQELIPEGITTSEIDYNDMDLVVAISGTADTRDSLLKIIKNYEDADFIEEVITPISNFDKKSDISFVLELKLIFKELNNHGEPSSE